MPAGKWITHRTFFCVVVGIMLVAFLLLPRTLAQHTNVPGVSSSQIDLGSCCPLTGLLAERGQQLQLGAQTYLQFVNEQGGISGRKIKLMQCDDHYDADSAITCFNSCLKEKVFAGAFFVGSAAIGKYVRMADTTRMPMLGFCSGSASIYESHPSVFVLRRGYADEIKQQVRELCGHRGIKRIAVIYQNDARGAVVRESAIQTLSGYGVRPVTEASYSRNAGEIEEAYRTVKQAKPQAVLLGVNAEALKALIKRKLEDNWQTLFVAESVADDYLEELGKAADGTILTQVVPLLSEEQLPAVKLFNRLHAKYAGKTPPANTAFESFLNALVCVEALKHCGQNLTRQGFVQALESLHDLDIGAGANYRVNFSSGNHVGWPLSSIYFTVVRGGRLSRITEADWASLVKPVMEPK
jgi:ABC-type branched-subunit amino acid transport system substrate-binding protein